MDEPIPVAAETPLPTVLVVDDDPLVRRTIMRQLDRSEWTLAEADGGEPALAATAESTIHVALVDLKMPGMDGHETIRRMRDVSPGTEIVAITGYGGPEIAFDVLREGASDYVEKPITDWLRLAQIVRRAIEVRELKADRDRLARARSEGGPALDLLLGNSAAMRDLQSLVRKVAPSPVPVLVTGESGTGKERVARALHQASARPDGPWVAINCAAIPGELLESELFGFERGGHSTATTRKPGLVEVANGGTLFLDEIGDMAAPMQAKLLRVLQEREIVRLGGTHPIPFDARVVAATNADLPRAIADGRFREDLYYRLRVVEVRVPPLRERKEDIPLLAWYFVGRCNREFGKRVRSIHPAAMAELHRRDWAENNVRQLEGALQRAVVLCQGEELTPDLFEDGPPATSATAGPQRGLAPSFADGVLDLPYADAKAAVVDRFTAAYLRAHLRTSGGNITKAALGSGLLRPNFKRLMNRHGVGSDD